MTRAIGVSRTDNYFDSEYIETMRRRLHEAFPDTVGKKVALYAPTFRGTADEAGEGDTDDVARLLESELPDDWYLMVSAHPHAREGKSRFCSEELMLIADVLITDYSSIIFDYLFLKKPVILYAPDYEEFGRLRGFYTPYEALPGRIVKDAGELSRAIEEECESYDPSRIESYLADYLEACDGHASERIVEYLKNGAL